MGRLKGDQALFRESALGITISQEVINIFHQRWSDVKSSQSVSNPSGHDVVCIPLFRNFYSIFCTAVSKVYICDNCHQTNGSTFTPMSLKAACWDSTMCTVKCEQCQAEILLIPKSNETGGLIFVINGVEPGPDMKYLLQKGPDAAKMDSFRRRGLVRRWKEHHPKQYTFTEAVSLLDITHRCFISSRRHYLISTEEINEILSSMRRSNQQNELSDLHDLEELLSSMRSSTHPQIEEVPDAGSRQPSNMFCLSQETNMMTQVSTCTHLFNSQ